MSAARITVLVGRFGPVIGHGLRAVLQRDPTVTLIEDGLDAAQLELAVARHRPRVVIVDESAVVTYETAKRLRQRHEDVGIVVLAANPSRAHAMALVGRGVTACLPKDASAADLSAAIRFAAAGTVVLDWSHEQPKYAISSEAAGELTGREREVLEALRLGQKNAQIAAALGISVETVRSHVKSVYRKLGVRTRRDLLGASLPVEPPRP